MDVLKPDLIWIEGICYRIPFLHNGGAIRPEDIDNEETSRPTRRRPSEDEMDAAMCESEEIFDDFEMDRTESGRYRTIFHVPRTYFSYIIGAKGSTRRRLEDETKTQIRIPKQGQSGDVVITGADERGVAAARRRITLILSSFRHKQQFTHFLSIPMTGKQIKKSFLAFKEEVCNLCKNHRIDESVFQTPEKLHLTLGTMVLADDVERSKVAELFSNFKDTVVQPLLKSEPLKLRMVGLEYMNDDPTEVDVLYGKVQLENGSDIDLLQQLADNLVSYFVQRGTYLKALRIFLAGFMKKQYENVKLHVTLMNTLFRVSQGDGSELERSDQKKRPRETFDASIILKTFEGYNFGEHLVEGIHLSQRYTTAADGYYQMSTIINFT